MGGRLTMPLEKAVWYVQEQRHGLYDWPNRPDVLGLFFHFRVEGQELFTSMHVSTAMAGTFWTYHILHDFARSVATPIAEDVHSEIVLISLALFLFPLLMQFKSFFGDSPFLGIRICVSTAHAALVPPTPAASHFTHTQPCLPIRISRNLGFFVCSENLWLGGSRICGGGCLAQGVSLVQCFRGRVLAPRLFSSAIA